MSKIHLRFVASKDTVDRLDRLKANINAETHAEVMRNALRLYEWIVETYMKGARLILVDKNNQLVEITMFHPDQHPGSPNTGRKLPDNVIELFPRIDN